MGSISSLQKAKQLPKINESKSAPKQDASDMAAAMTEALKQQQSAAPSQDPIDALKMKFVNGEITEEEYKSKKELQKS